jgi:hypothetical protein
MASSKQTILLQISTMLHSAQYFPHKFELISYDLSTFSSKSCTAKGQPKYEQGNSIQVWKNLHNRKDQ